MQFTKEKPEQIADVHYTMLSWSYSWTGEHLACCFFGYWHYQWIFVKVLIDLHCPIFLFFNFWIFQVDFMILIPCHGWLLPLFKWFVLWILFVWVFVILTNVVQCVLSFLYFSLFFFLFFLFLGTAGRFY